MERMKERKKERARERKKERKKGIKLTPPTQDFFAYTLLDKAVDELFPIVVAYRRRLRWFKVKIATEKTRFRKGKLQEVSRIKLELNECHRTTRPILRIMSFLIDDRSIGADSTLCELEGERSKGNLCSPDDPPPPTHTSLQTSPTRKFGAKQEKSLIAR